MNSPVEIIPHNFFTRPIFSEHVNEVDSEQLVTTEFSLATTI